MRGRPLGAPLPAPSPRRPRAPARRHRSSLGRRRAARAGDERGAIMKVHPSRNALSAPPGDGWPRIATRIATPSADPSWRDMPSTAVPVAKRAGGSGAVAAADSSREHEPDARAAEQLAGQERRCVVGRDAHVGAPPEPAGGEEQRADRADVPLSEALPEQRRPGRRTVAAITGPGAIWSPARSTDSCHTAGEEQHAAEHQRAEGGEEQRARRRSASAIARRADDRGLDERRGVARASAARRPATSSAAAAKARARRRCPSPSRDP